MKKINSYRAAAARLLPLCALLLAITAAPACGDEDEDVVDACAATSEGALTIDTYGEEYIEEGIPAEEFVDGWAVTFDTFLIHLESASASRGACGGGLEAPTARVFDVAQPSGGVGAEVAMGQVSGGSYDNVSYRISPAGAGAAAGNATAEQVGFMKDNGYAIYVEGTAEKGGVQKTFKWGFATDTRYVACEGTAVVGSSPARTELTIHGDHLFYDDLFSEEPNVAFQLIADADADGNGEVTEAELAATDLSSQERYQVGSADVSNLLEFIAAQTQTLGHIDGEGHCETE